MSSETDRDSTPSPVSKKDGSNKRIMVQQSTSIPPKQPTLDSHNELTMEDIFGTDGREANSNPESNPTLNVIPTTTSRQMYDQLYKYKQIETKLTKVNHHIEFLSTCVKEGRVPLGLRWNININVMESDENINQELRQHQVEAELALLKIMIKHYLTVRNKLNNERATIENTLENIKTEENQSTIDKSIQDLAVEKQTLSKKLKQKRMNKLRNLQSGAIRVSESFASVLPRRSDRPLNSQIQSHQQNLQPRSFYSPVQTDPRTRRITPPPVQYPTIRQEVSPRPPTDPRTPRITSPIVQHQTLYRETSPRSSVNRQHPENNQLRPPENNFGVIVNTFSTFLMNLNQQTSQLLSSLNQLNYQTRRNQS